MKAAWYKKQGSAKSVIKAGDIDTPNAKPGEVRVKIAYSGLNPTDIKRRQGFGGQPQAYPIIIPPIAGDRIKSIFLIFFLIFLLNDKVNFFEIFGRLNNFAH